MSQAGKGSSTQGVDSLFTSIMGQLESNLQQQDSEASLLDLPSLKGLIEGLFQHVSPEEKQLLEQTMEALKEKIGQHENIEEAAYMLLASIALQPQEIKNIVAKLQQDGVLSKQVADKLAPLLEQPLIQKELTEIKKVVEKWQQKKDEAKMTYLQGVLERVFPNEGKEAGISILPTRTLPIYQPMESINLHVAPPTEGKAVALYVAMNGNKVNEQQFIRNFQQMLMNGNLTSANGIQKLSIKLYPEHLGAVHVDIIKRGGEMIAKIVASSGTAREALENQVQQLRAAFVNQNISVDKVEIASYLQQWKQHQQNNQSAHEQQQQHKRQVADEDEENTHSFLEELTNLKA